MVPWFCLCAFCFVFILILFFCSFQPVKQSMALLQIHPDPRSYNKPLWNISDASLAGPCKQFSLFFHSLVYSVKISKLPPPPQQVLFGYWGNFCNLLQLRMESWKFCRRGSIKALSKLSYANLKLALLWSFLSLVLQLQKSKWTLCYQARLALFSFSHINCTSYPPHRQSSSPSTPISGNLCFYERFVHSWKELCVDRPEEKKATLFLSCIT